MLCVAVDKVVEEALVRVVNVVCVVVVAVEVMEDTLLVVVVDVVCC